MPFLRRSFVLALTAAAATQDAPGSKALLFAARPHAGEGDNAGFGAGIAAIGDVNRDGDTDYAIGAPRDPSRPGSEGSVSVFSGRDGRLLFLHRAAAGGSAFGHSVAGGDVDGDGWADVVVGAPYAAKGDRQHVGEVHLFSGKDGRLLRTLSGKEEGEVFGWAVTGLGDRDGDKCDDFAVSAPHANRVRNRLLVRDVGRVEAHSGKRLKLLFSAWGDIAEDRFGWCLVDLGDMNGDGQNDLLVGAEGALRGDARPGSATLLSGRGGSMLTRLFGDADAYFGVAACSIGDLDGDGRSEFAIGAWNAGDEDARPGEVAVFAGGTARLLHRLRGHRNLDHFGQALAGVGDVDGDGVADLAIGAPSKSGLGYVQLVSGKSLGVIGELTGETAEEGFGATLVACDLDGDGKQELLVGAPWSDLLRPTPGRVVVYSRSKLERR